MKSTVFPLNPMLLIGVPAIDKEHGELARQLDELVANPQDQPDSANFLETLSQLGGQINAHFNSEEKFFKSLGMPDALVSNHVQAHTDILVQYTQLNMDIMQMKVPDRADVLKLIKNWIIEHIVRHDLTIRDYLPTRSVSVD